ncbi:hypothetical protein KC19_VG134200 [Ceratodon purpureus]|uniref:CCHC-type domain-containing protein n=1 Tax=Ceratodon purpureus TaxID=3225 RepID=A0A8T0HQT8_CERPU|nr:hypothetical protein KC19_VG134200 [Ceratodon purpureus]
MNPNSKETEGLWRSSRKKKGDQESEARPFVTTRVDFAEDIDQVIAGTPGSGRQGGTVPPEPEDGGQVAEVAMARTFSRLKYRKFKGDGWEDVDEWLSELDAMAAANQEDEAIKLRFFQGLLKKEALQWYKEESDNVKQKWDLLSVSSWRAFREVGGEARTLGKLSKIRMELEESVRRYGQWVRSLIHKLSPGIANSIQVEWYVAGLPEWMGLQVRQTRLQTLPEAMEAAQNYENSKQSILQYRKAGKTFRRLRKIRRNRDSSSESSGSSSKDCLETGDSSSEEDRSRQKASGSKGYRKEKERTIVRVKEESVSEKRMIKDLVNSIEELKVQMAEEKKARKALPSVRNNVWCTNCGKAGHYNRECPHGATKRVQFVDKEGSVFFAEPAYEEEEMEMLPVYHVNPAYGRGRMMQPVIRP